VGCLPLSGLKLCAMLRRLRYFFWSPVAPFFRQAIQLKINAKAAVYPWIRMTKMSVSCFRQAKTVLNILPNIFIVLILFEIVLLRNTGTFLVSNTDKCIVKKWDKNPKRCYDRISINALSIAGRNNRSGISRLNNVHNSRIMCSVYSLLHTRYVIH